MTRSHLNRSKTPSCGYCPRSAQHSPILPLHLDLAFELAVGIRVARGATCNTSVGVEYARTLLTKYCAPSSLLDNLPGAADKREVASSPSSSRPCLSIYLHMLYALQKSSTKFEGVPKYMLEKWRKLHD